MNEANPKKIFISYGHDEYETLAKKIKEDLEELGHKVWFDRSKLKAGRDWEISIENGLKGTQIVLVMMSPYSMRRPDGYCLNELSMACILRREIIPIMVKDCIPPLSINRIQWLDFKEWPNISEERYKEKFAQIRDVIEGKILSFEGSHNLLLNKLKPIDFKAEIEEHVRKFFGREWIFEEIKEWLYRDPESRVFFLTGKPGIGKTAISSMLCRKFPEVKAYHLVKFGDTRKSDAIECVLSLAYQLSTQISEYADKLLMIDFEGIREMSAMTAFDELIVQPLFDLTPPSKPVLIVIDALDEAKKGDDNILVSFLGESFKLVPEWLKLFITSRPESDILNLLSSLKPHPLDTEDIRNLADIKGYLKLKLEELFPNTTINNALEMILERSEGIFLYVQEVLNELKLGRLDLDHPEKFPKGLTQVYTNFFKRQFPVREDYNKYQRPLLELITAAREPLDIKMIYNLLNWDDYSMKLSIEPLRSFLTIESSIFSKREGLEDQVDFFITQEIDDEYEEITVELITLFHKSITEWLTSNQTDIKFYISSKKGHESLANEGWKIYKSDIKKLNLYFLTHLPIHLLKLPIPEWEKITKILSDLQYIEKCAYNGLISNLIKNYQEVLASKNVPEKYKKTIQEFKQFLINQAHILRKYSQLTLQQAINQLDISAPSKAAKKILKEKGLSEPWFEWINKPQEHDQCVLTFQGHDDSVLRGVFSPDGTKILSASKDNTLKLWDVETGTEIRTFIGHSKVVWGCAFSPDGTKLVSASGDNTLKLWDVETGTEIRTLIGHAGDVNACTFSPDGTNILSASSDKTLKLWDPETCEESRTFIGHTGSINECGFSPDGNRVLSASSDRTLKLWELETGKEIRSFEGHSNTVWGCAFSPDGKNVLSASMDSVLIIWDVETGREIKSLRGHSFDVYGCNFSPDGKKLLSASWDSTLKLWDADADIGINWFKGHLGAIEACTFSPDGKKLLSGSHDSTLKLWNTETGQEIRTFIGHSGDVLGCSYSPDGTMVLSASKDKTLKLWDVNTGMEIKTFEGHTAPVWECAFSPDGRKILSSSDDLTLKLWDIESGEEIRSFEGHSSTVWGCAFSPDGMRIISASRDETLKLWDTETAQEIKTFVGHSYLVSRCAYSPDGTIILSASGDTTLKLWDSKTGDEISTFKGHSFWVQACAFLSDGKRVLSSSTDKTLKLWNAETLDELLTFPAIGGVYSIATGPMNFIATGDLTGRIYILRVHGINLEPTIVTPVRLYNLNTQSYDTQFSINCKLCGVRFPLDDEMLWSKSEDHPEGRLGEVIECPTCHKPLKLNPFVVGKRG